MFELCKQFRFEAAHTLERTVDAEPSRRIHGHSYRAEVVIRGAPDPRTGMIIDASLFEAALAVAQDGLDHRFLDDVPGLGPATLENLAAWIWRALAPSVAGLARVTVYRDSRSESCTYFGPVGL
ncbi:MAG: 6-carboxytetrahydropterin synthase [Acetobacteraceae bacterium]